MRGRHRRFPWRVFSRIVLLQAVLVLAALAASGIAARYFFKRQFTSQSQSQLRSALDVLARDLPASPAPGWCASHSATPNLRLTLILPNGHVLCDSAFDSREMESHANRPEVIQALRESVGLSQRYSTTLQEQTIYVALALRNASIILRGSVAMSHLRSTLETFDRSLALFLVALGMVMAILGAWSVRRLVFPIGRLVLKAQNVLGLNDRRLDDDAGDDEAEESYGELGDLEDSLDSIRRDLQAKAERLDLQHEEQATLMSAISDSILAVDLEEIPLFYNSRFAVIFGRSKVREREFRLWEVFREPEILEAFRAALKEARSNSVAAIPFDQEEGRKYFSVSVAPLRRSDGQIYGAVGVFHDVTELKLAEQIRIDFVANVSHELRTPLTAIKGYAETIANDIADKRPVEKEFVDVIGRNTDRLMSLINDLLDLSSLESNVDELVKIEVLTQDFTARVLSQVKGAFERKGQSVELTIQAPSVCADTRRLEQVVVNLLDNASKYTPAGGKINVAWMPDKRAGSVLLKISDTGPGIPREHHARLFERFYRVDKARSRELGGTGLGLAIVKHIMQRHGGNVWVESTPGQGSTFVCKFPNDEKKDKLGT